MNAKNLLWGVDLGGTKIELAVIDPKNPFKPLLRKRTTTEREQGYKHILSQIEKLLLSSEQELQQEAKSLGFGTPGSQNPITGFMRNCNTTCLNEKDLQADLEGLLQRPVKIANDANCFALAEARIGAGKGCASVFGVILGTGVGGGIVLDGKIHKGNSGIAGEWGHNVLERSGENCYCGKKGCVEKIISGPALEAFYRELSGSELSLDAVYLEGLKGNIQAQKTFERLYEKLTEALSVVINILDPACIVLGGGVSNTPGLAEEVNKRLKPHVFSDSYQTRVIKNQLGDSAGVYGACWLVQDTE
jgi:predicted NBD/HSP70 family sugar kinase